MFRHRHVRRRGRHRLLLLAVFGVALAGAAWGSYEVYRYRKQLNTQELLQQAEKASVAAEWDKAAVAYWQYLQRKPDDREALQAYSDVLLERVKTTPAAIGDAVRTLRRLVGLEPHNVEAVTQLTRLYVGLREYGAAEELAENWRSLDPSSVEAIVAQAFAQHRLHKSQEAADTLVAAIAQNPGEPELYPLLVQLLAGELDQPDQAGRWLTDALRVGPDVPGVHLAAFKYYKNQEELEKAEKHLRRALDLAPDSLDALLSAGMWYLGQGRLDEAKSALDRADQNAPNNAGILSARASWAIQAGDNTTLSATADEFLNLAEDGSPVFLAEAARLYLRAGKIERASKCLAKLDSLPQGSGQFDARLDALKGECALRSGELYSAINHLRSALRLAPADVGIKRMLATAYAETGNLEEAVELFRGVVLMAPDDTAVRFRLAELEWRQGRLSEARDAVNALPGTSDTQQHTAELIRLACKFREHQRGNDPLEERDGWLLELKRLASSVPRDAIPSRWLLRCLVLADRSAEALDLYKAHQSNPKIGPGLGIELGHLLLIEGQGDTALTLAEELIEQSPKDAEGHVLRAKALAVSGRLSKAVSDYANHDDLPEAALGQVLEAIADEYVMAGKTEPGMDLYRRAADLAPGNISARRKLVRRTMDLDEAQRRIAEIRTVEGDAGLIWKSEQAAALLRLDLAAESLSTARELLEQCLSQRPRWPSLRLQLGYVHELTGEFQDAVAAYQAAIAQQPGLNERPVMIRLVGLLNRLGRFAQADALLDSLRISLSDEPVILRFQTGRLIREGNLDSAVATAERLLELHPDDPAWTAATADLHLRVGNPERAEAIARTALPHLSDSAPMLWLLAKALIAQNRSAEARRLVEEAAANEKDAPHQLLLARVLAGLDLHREAEAAIARAQKLAPDDAAVWGACADFWASLNQRTRQIACMRKAVELRGEDPTRSIALAQLLLTGGTADDRAQANGIVQRHLTTHPEDEQALLLDGRLAMLEKHPDFYRAEKSIRRALSIDPKLAAAYRLLGLVHVRAGRLAAARESVETGLALASDDVPLLMASAEIHIASGVDGRAIPVLRHLLQLRPRMPAALKLLVGALVNTNQVDRAIALVEAQAPEDVRTPDELVTLARLYESKGDINGAEELFRRAKELDESSSDIHRELLYFLARKRDFDEVQSLAALRQTLEPDDIESLAIAAEALCSLGDDDQIRDIGLRWLEEIARDHREHAADATYRSAICHYKQGRLDAAEGQFRESLRHAPTHARSVNDLAWLYAEDLGEPGKAVILIEQFLSMGGIEDAHLLDTHSVALLRMGELIAAEEKARQCLRIAGNTPTRTAATYHLGVTLLKSGRPGDARPHLRRAMELHERRGGLTPKEQKVLQQLLSTGPSIDNAENGPKEG